MNIWKLNIYVLVISCKRVKIKIFQNLCILSLDKQPGGISTMIESSTKALALNCEFINIFLPDSILSNKHFFKQLLDIKNLNINKINFLDKSFLKFGFIKQAYKK